MVRVRLARAGAKKRPFYHIVVTDQENPRDGRFLERLGYFDPGRPVGEARIDDKRLDEWIEHGARASDRVLKILRSYRAARDASA